VHQDGSASEDEDKDKDEDDGDSDAAVEAQPASALEDEVAALCSRSSWSSSCGSELELALEEKEE
jgi:hypothetical protein